jgi:pilus assembly protein CpaF
VSEVTGMESDVISLQDLFLFERQGVSKEGRTVGTFFSNGIRPKFSDQLKSLGFELPADMFEQMKERWK